MKKEMEKDSMQVEDEDWFDIQRYYLENAPAILSQPVSKKRIVSGDIFQESNLMDSIPGAVPVVTMVEYDQKHKILYTGDISGNFFEFYRAARLNHRKINNIPIDVDINPEANSLEVLCIGSLMPTEEMTGQLITLDSNGSKSILVDSLRRPLNFVRHDFNGDGVNEYLIASFGSTTGPVNSGRLSLYVLIDGVYEEKLVKLQPGATKSVIGDFNNDGRPDIISLFSQGKETIILFLNRGNFEFEEKILLEFKPAYGTNDFEITDINKDAFADIIVTNGDNGDNTPVFKFYHGVRIFINNGKNEFTEDFFYPINGASQVLLRDFDNDEDMDFVLLAMYPDLFRWPDETLVYFENEGDLNFSPGYIEKEPSGKWLLMDAADIDEDGDEDLIVGANLLIQGVLIPPGYKKKWNSEGIAYRIFINQTIQ